MNCQGCGRLLYVNQTRCQCLKAVTWPAETKAGAVTKRHMPLVLVERLKKIGLQRYEQETDAEYAMRCRRYLFQHHSVMAKTLFPEDVAKRLQDENEREAKAERAAIQAAG